MPGMSSSSLPTLFISHGSPMTALEPREAGAFMQRLGPAIEAAFGKPKAVLAISAHSLAREPVLLAAEQHQAVYDFSGFDQRLYSLRYDAPGAPELALRVAALLEGAGIAVHRVNEGGLDHGIWTPLRYMFPHADVPVLPLAWPADWSPERLLALGVALSPLAEQGVLVMGTGSLTHNLRRVLGGGQIPQPDALPTLESSAFRQWFAERGAAADGPALLDYRRQAPHAVLMHPSDEHLLPFFVAAGAAGPKPVALRIHESVVFGDLAMDAFAFGSAAAQLAAVLRS
jgi:4,5-DOPA dioxygenase extradiol